MKHSIKYEVFTTIKSVYDLICTSPLLSPVVNVFVVLTAAIALIVLVLVVVAVVLVVLVAVAFVQQ